MRGYSILSILLLVASATADDLPKRGFSGFLGDYFTCSDAKALGLDRGWYYNWLSHGSAHKKCDGLSTANEFVPMVIGINAAVGGEWQSEWKTRNVKYLLGYNEPDPGNHPHAVHPVDAAADWPRVQRIAADPAFREPLTLVSPAVSTKGLDAEGKSQWLDEFFSNCSTVVKDCHPDLIKYIAFHDYEGSVEGITKRINGASKRYGRKVWLTEFAILHWGAPPPRSAMDAYLKELLPVLDGNPNLFRYAWFTARNKPNEMNGGSSLLPWNSSSLEPTSTGKIYSLKAAVAA